MKSTALAAAAFAVAMSHTSARSAEEKDKQEGEVEIALPDKRGGEPVILSSGLQDFCFFAGSPPPDESYTVIRQFKIGKGTYGGVKDILPRVASRAQQMGADAVINYTSSQRFGFFPWRVVRPVVGGVAIKWTTPKKRDCDAMGGATLQTILDTDEPPSRAKRNQTKPPAPTPMSSPSSAADRLKTLEDLRDRNLISPAEYDERRRKILDGL
jgi:hypothetical protein